MPLIDIKRLTPSTQLGLWRMDEHPHELVQRYPALQELAAEVSRRFRSLVRQQERLCVHALLQEMTGSEELIINHAPSGKPMLEGYQISISHTRGYAALMLSTEEQVAVDIEQRSDRVQRIAKRFLRPDEHANTTEQMLAHWSAKETVYKLFSVDVLAFEDMQVTNMYEGLMHVENKKRNVQVPVRLEWNDDYVLTYAWLPAEV